MFSSFVRNVWGSSHTDKYLALILSHGSYGGLLNSTPKHVDTQFHYSYVKVWKPFPLLICFSLFFTHIWCFTLSLCFSFETFKRTLCPFIELSFSNGLFYLKLCLECSDMPWSLLKSDSLIWHSARLLLGILLLALCSSFPRHGAWRATNMFILSGLVLPATTIYFWAFLMSENT